MASHTERSVTSTLEILKRIDIAFNKGSSTKRKGLIDAAELTNLFEIGQIIPDDFNWDVLSMLVSKHCGWETNDALLRVLFKYIRKAVWLAGSDKYSQNMLDLFAVCHLSSQQMDYYVSELLDWMELNWTPAKVLDYVNKIDSYGNILTKLAYYASTVVPRLLGYGMDPNPIIMRESDEFNPELGFYKYDNVIMPRYPQHLPSFAGDIIYGLLTEFKCVKNVLLLAQIKVCIGALIAHGAKCDWSVPCVDHYPPSISEERLQIMATSQGLKAHEYHIKSITDGGPLKFDGSNVVDRVFMRSGGNNVLEFWDFVRGYGWEEYLADVLPSYLKELPSYKRAARPVCHNYLHLLKWRDAEHPHISPEFEVKMDELLIEAHKHRFVKGTAAINEIMKGKVGDTLRFIKTTHESTDRLHNDFFQCFGFTTS